jgi:peptidoglycan/LPS O-acetylase OafA/YrhL
MKKKRFFSRADGQDPRAIRSSPPPQSQRPVLFGRVPALTHPKYRPDIDGLRAVAVLSVVGFHAFPAWVKGGFIGVDIFFVISGYLISSIIFSGLESGSFRIADFYRRRIRRIFPALIVVMIASLSFGWFALLADEYAQLGKHVAAGAAFLSNFIFYGESGYFDNAAGTKPMLHLWTLAIEEQFYIFWPLMLAFVWKRKWNFLSLTAAIAIFSFAANLYLVSRNPPAAFYWPMSRFWELMIGGLLAYITLHEQGLLVARKNLQSLTGFALLGAGLALINKEDEFPGWWALLPTVGSFFVISAGPAGWLNKYLLSNKLMVWVGLISYPLYLWHWPILSFARILESQEPYRNLRIAAVLLSILLAAITYLWVEKPLRSARNAAIYLLVTMSCIATVGLATFYNDGFGRRLGKDFAALKPNNKIEESMTLKACENFHPMDISLKMNCWEFGVNTNDNVAIYGDSHAMAAAQGIADYLRDRSVGTYLYAKTACPLFLGIGVGPNKAERKKCFDLAEESLKSIMADRTIKKVFIFTRGPMYLTGRQSADDTVGYLIVPPKEFKDSLQKTIDYLNGAGKAVYYVTENPELDSSPYACERRPFRLRKRNCDVYKVDVLLRQQEYLQILSEVSRVKVIYTIDKFCPNGKCLTEIDGSYLYGDADHLSTEGSKFQAKEVLSEFLLE